jgi:hypothetical protein
VIRIPSGFGSRFGKAAGSVVFPLGTHDAEDALSFSPPHPAAARRRNPETNARNRTGISR